MTGDVVATLSGHTGLVRAVRVSADGSRIVTASDDRTARVWEVPTGREIAFLVGHALRVRVSIMGRSRGRHLPMMLTRAGVWTYDGASWQNVCYDLIDDALEISVAVDANGRYVVVGQKLTGVQTGTTIVRRVTP
ncbi:MAG TPA: hypothetical protein VKE22_09175 [Haliangiales bacterium]|nr:hypothetical protein [Haliangiales bacterium]